MAMRLQEVHPSLVHYPIALLPVSIGADALGKVTGSRTLLGMGKMGIALTAGTAALAGVFGLIAQEEVKLNSDRAGDLLVTHRNLNVGFLALATMMAVRRSMRRKPSMRYLVTGAAAIGAVAYSAYLGGKMVYEHGVGVKAADGIAEGHAPELRLDRLEELSEHALQDVKDGVRHAAEALADGKIVPAIGARPMEPVREAGVPRAADGPQP